VPFGGLLFSLEKTVYGSVPEVGSIGWSARQAIRASG